MPFNFITFEHYSIDYKRLFNELNSQKIFNDTLIQTQYLHNWMDVLKDCDNTTKRQLNSIPKILHLRSMLSSEPEIFQNPILHEDNTIFIHFRISIMKELVEESKYEGQPIELSEFTCENSEIRWNPVKGHLDDVYGEKPIILIPFENNQYHHLVVDGNHRLTYKINNNQRSIKAIVFSEKSAIEHSVFSSGFDKHYYIMMNEINYISNRTHYNNSNAKELASMSFLIDGKYKF